MNMLMSVRKWLCAGMVLTLALMSVGAVGDADDFNVWYEEITDDNLPWLMDMPCVFYSQRTIDGEYYVVYRGGYSDSIKPDPIPGYTFSRWLVQRQWVDYFDGVPLYAQWMTNAADVVVRFNANDGVPSDSFSQRKIYPATGSMSDQEFSYGVSQKLKQCAFVRKGYSFLGWKKYTDSGVRHVDMANLNLSKSDVSADVYDLYAVWKAGKVRVTFDFQGWPAGKNHTTAYTVGEKFSEGEWHYDWGEAYVVDGWFNSAGVKVTSSDYVPAEDGTLYLHFHRKEYTVRFDANGGTGTMASRTFQYGVSTALPKNEFSNGGRQFKGWSRTKDGNVEFTDGQTVSKIESMAGLKSLTVRLYAVWAPPQPYTITYKPGSYGTGESIVDQYGAGASATLRGALFTREGYVQTGWTTVDGGSKTHLFGGVYNAGKGLTLYATWTAPKEADYMYSVDNGEAWITGYKGSDVDIVIPSKIAGCPVVGISEGAFYWSGYRFNSVIIPKGVRVIDDYAFGNMDTLTYVDIPSSVEKIGEHAFFDCDGLVSVTFPPCKSVGGYVFNGCDQLRSVILSPGIKMIGQGMFYDCTALESIIIPNSVVEIRESAFAWCEHLSEVTILNGIKTIGVNFVFSGCTNLSALVIPESVESIADYAFSGCSALEKVIFLGARPGNESLGGTLMNGSSSCVFYALPDKNGWGSLPTSWGRQEVQGPAQTFPCMVMFDPNGGTGKMADLVCESGDKVYQLPCCSFTPPKGKRFAGWRSMLGRRYDDGMLVFGLRSLGGIVMMTAIWE